MKKGMGARFRENELSSSQDMHGSHHFSVFFHSFSNMGLVVQNMQKRYG